MNALCVQNRLLLYLGYTTEKMQDGKGERRENY